jgi:hypothetical protein
MKTLKIAAGVLLIAALAVSCIPKGETMGTSGQTLIKLYPAGFTVVALSPTSSSQTLPLFELRRDVPSEGALNASTTVVLKFDNTSAIINKYNTDNGTSFIILPNTLYSTSPAPIADGTVSVTLGAGEYVKSFMITVPNAFNFDFSKQYALAYKVLSVSGEGTLSANVLDTVVVQVLAKNKYDGIYVVTANSPMVDVTNTTLTGYYPFKYKLITTGEHTCDVFEFDNDYPLHPILSGTSWSYYGSFGLKIGFNTSGSGVITTLTNYFGTPSNTRAAALDPSGTNTFNTTSKKILIKYFMKQPSVVTAAPNIRVYFDETWTYSGPR